MIGFKPVKTVNGTFRCFWSLASGWGEFEISRDRVELRVLYGELKLKTLRLPIKAKSGKCSVIFNGRNLDFNRIGDSIVLSDGVVIGKGQALRLRLQ
jgi:hypothetical protein